MTHFIKQIAKSDDSYNFNKNGDYFFRDTFGTDVSIANGQHSRTGKVNRVDIFDDITLVFNVDAFDPIVGVIELRCAIED